MQYRLEEYGFSQVGRLTDRFGRPRQEDCISPAPGEPGGALTPVFVVCDGMGGKETGYAAASAVCRAVRRAIGNPALPFSLADVDIAVDAAYRAIDAVVPVGAGHVASTLAFARFFEGGVVCAHIGDSRIYYIRPGQTAAATRILYRSADHTYANALVQRGELSPQEAACSDKRKALTRAILPHAPRRFNADVVTLADVRPGDCLLLCTDGVYDSVPDDILRNIFSYDGGSLQNKKALLLKAASASNDNYSAILVGISAMVAETPAPELEIDPEPDERLKYDNQNHFDMTAKKASQSLTLPVRLLLAFVAITAVLMMVYSWFIRTDEVLQPAGTAVDKPFDEPQETFGYEITAQDIKNEAAPIVEEDSVFISEEEMAVPDVEPAPVPDETASPREPADEPILQF